MTDTPPPGATDPRLESISHEVVIHERARTLDEAARLRGLEPGAVIKTMVVRREQNDYIFVLVPGDRRIDWPKLRAHLDERRLSMPDGEEVVAATGYEPGTITPLGAANPWPVLADRRLASGAVSIGAGRHGWSITVDGADLIDTLSADVADVTRPANDR